MLYGAENSECNVARSSFTRLARRRCNMHDVRAQLGEIERRA